MVKLFFDEFKEELSDLPTSARPDIFEMLSCRSYPLRQRILTQSEKSGEMYFMCQGNALFMKSEKIYDRFVQNETREVEEDKIKFELKEKPSFSSMAQIGWIFLHHVLSNDKLRYFIEKRQAKLEAQNFEESIEEIQG